MPYKCGDCGKILENLDLTMPVRCPYCGYRVMFKHRQPIAKKVSAR